MATSIANYLQKHPRLQWGFAWLKQAANGAYLRSCERPPQEKSGKFIFIVGCGRSGNTLLRRLLMEEYSIYIPPETYVLANQIVRYNKISSRSWPERVDVVLSALEYHQEFSTFGVQSLAPFAQEAKMWASEKRNLFSLVDGLYRWIGGESGRLSDWIGDKTPLNTLNLGVIHRAFPNAKFIYLERDPVDVVYSYLESGIYTDVRKAAERWVKSTVAWENFRRLHGERKCLEIRYENLVMKPSETLETIGSKFGLPSSSCVSAEPNLNLGDVETYLHHANSLNPPSVTSIGKGRRKASELVLREVRPIILGYAKKRGYADV